MVNYGESIGKVRKYLRERPVREIRCPSSVDELMEGLPVKVGPGANPGVILRSDVFAEMGNPAEGSSGFIVWTEDSSLIRDGLISLIGSDIPEMGEGASVPFGQVIMLGGAKLTAELQEKIEQCQHISDELEGYMVRSSAQGITGRVSRDAVAKGFSLETLGKALMINMKSNVPEIEAVEVVFVTSSKDDVRQLGEIAVEVDDIRKEVIKSVWEKRGYEGWRERNRHTRHEGSRGGCK